MVDVVTVGPDEGEALGKGPPLVPELGSEVLGMIDAVTVGPDEGEALGKGSPVGPALVEALGMIDTDAVRPDDSDALGKGPPVGPALVEVLGLLDGDAVGPDDGEAWEDIEEGDAVGSDEGEALDKALGLLDVEAAGPVGEALGEALVGNGDKYERSEWSEYSVLPPSHGEWCAIARALAMISNMMART